MNQLNKVRGVGIAYVEPGGGGGWEEATGSRASEGYFVSTTPAYSWLDLTYGLWGCKASWDEQALGRERTVQR